MSTLPSVRKNDFLADYQGETRHLKPGDRLTVTSRSGGVSYRVLRVSVWDKSDDTQGDRSIVDVSSAQMKEKGAAILHLCQGGQVRLRLARRGRAPLLIESLPGARALALVRLGLTSPDQVAASKRSTLVVDLMKSFISVMERRDRSWSRKVNNASRRAEDEKTRADAAERSSERNKQERLEVTTQLSRLADNLRVSRANEDFARRQRHEAIVRANLNY